MIEISFDVALAAPDFTRSLGLGPARTERPGDAQGRDVQPETRNRRTNNHHQHRGGAGSNCGRSVAGDEREPALLRTCRLAAAVARVRTQPRREHTREEKNQQQYYEHGVHPFLRSRMPRELFAIQR
jgi:hypothetical protein